MPLYNKTHCIHQIQWAFVYVHELVSESVPDPVEYYKEYVRQENDRRSALFEEETRPRAFAEVQEIYTGHMLFSSLLDKLDVRETISTHQQGKG